MAGFTKRDRMYAERNAACKTEEQLVECIESFKESIVEYTAENKEVKKKLEYASESRRRDYEAIIKCNRDLISFNKGRIGVYENELAKRLAAKKEV